MTERERQRERERIATIFAAHRMTPAAPYDDSHFLDFLIDNPASKRAVYETIAGMQRFNAFLHQVQLEYSVHFSKLDRSAHYSLDAFAARVAELRDSPRTSMATFQAETKAAPGWLLAVVLSNLVVALPALLLLDKPRLLVVIAVLLVLLNGGWFFWRKHNNRYNAQLYKQLSFAIDAQRKHRNQTRLQDLV